MADFTVALWMFFVICITTAFSVYGCAVHVSYLVLLLFDVSFVITFVVSLKLWRYLFDCFSTCFLMAPVIGLSVTLFNSLGMFSKMDDYCDIDSKLKMYLGLSEYDRWTITFLIWSNVFLIALNMFHYVCFHNRILKFVDSFCGFRERCSNDTSTTENGILSGTLDYNMFIKAERMAAAHFAKLSYQTNNVISRSDSDLYNDVYLNFAYSCLGKLLIVLTGLLSVCNVCLMHFVLLVTSVTIMFSAKRTRFIFECIMTCLIAAMFVTRLFYQTAFFKHEYWNFRCSISNKLNKTGNVIEWFGYYKTDLNDDGMVTIIVLPLSILAISALFKSIYVKQSIAYEQFIKNNNADQNTTRHNSSYLSVLFPDATYRKVDDGFSDFVKFIINYGFYRIGIELICIGYVIQIGVRMDSFALLYGCIIMGLVFLPRTLLQKWWTYLRIFMAISVVTQYATMLVFSDNLCLDWHRPDTKCRKCFLYWLLTPLNNGNNRSFELFGDFCLFFLISEHLGIFHIEQSIKDDFPGGSNKCRIRDDIKNLNYVASGYDFVETKKTMLDGLKRCLLYSHIWFIFAVSFVAIFCSINVFSFGYVIISILLFWTDDNFYAATMERVLLRWNIVLLYNVVTLLMKNIIQLPSCAISQFDRSSIYYAFLRTIGIGTCPKFTARGTVPVSEEEEDYDYNYYYSDYANKFTNLLRENETITIACCPYASDVFYDCLCFVFLILQRKLFCTDYIVPIVDEAKTLQLLESRGTELMAKLEAERINEEMKSEYNDFKKVDHRINKLKMVKAMLNDGKYEEPVDLRDTVNSGDYYMCLEDELVDYFLTPVPKVSGISLSPSVKISCEITVEDIVSDYFCPCSLPYYYSPSQSDNNESSSGDGYDKKKLSKNPETGNVVAASGTESEGEDKIPKKFSKRRPKMSEEERKSTGGKPKISVRPPGRSEIYFARKFLSIAEFMKRLMVYDFRVMATINKDKLLIKETVNLRLPMDVLREMDLRLTAEPVELIGKPLSEQTKKIRLITAIIELCSLVYPAFKFYIDVITYVFLLAYAARQPNLTVFMLPLLVLCWGTLYFPRADKAFWIPVTRFVQCVVVIKLFVQLDIVVWYYAPVSVGDGIVPNILSYIGIVKFKMINDGVWLFFLIIQISLLRVNLKYSGFWSSGKVIDTVPSIMNYTNKVNYFIVDITRLIKQGIHLLVLSCFELCSFGIVSFARQKIVIKDHCSTLFCKLKAIIKKLGNDENRFPKDIYFHILVCDLLSTLLMIWGFHEFVPPEDELLRRLPQRYVYHSVYNVPYAFVILFSILILATVCDRILYVARYLIGKLVLQLFLIIVVHIYMFVYLPWMVLTEFNHLPYIPYAWYLLKCLYFLMSCYILHYGYPVRTNKTGFTYRYSIFRGLLYKVFLYFPILFQLVTTLDWCVAKTSLDRKRWDTVQILFGENYVRKCYLRFFNYWSYTHATNVPFYRKLIGFLILLLILAVLLFPIYFYTFFAFISTRPSTFHLSIDLVPFGRLYEVNVKLEDSDVLSREQWTAFKDAFIDTFGSSGLINSYSPIDVTRVKLPPFPQEPLIVDTNVLRHMRAPNTNPRKKLMTVRSSWQIQRKTTNIGTHTIVDGDHVTSVPIDYLTYIAEGFVKPDVEIVIPAIIPKLLRIGRFPFTKNLRFRWEDTELIINYGGIRCTSVSRFETNLEVGATWKLEEINHTDSAQRAIYASMLMFAPSNVSEYINLFVLNDRLYPAGLAEYLAKYSFIVMYWFICGTLFGWVRAYKKGPWYSGIWYRKICNVDRILELFHNIELVRQYGNLIYEEYLYATLIFLYRSPDAFHRWSGYPCLEKDVT